MKKIAAFLKKWIEMKTTQAAIVLAATATMGFYDGKVDMNTLVDKVAGVILTAVTLYLTSNIGENKK